MTLILKVQRLKTYGKQTHAIISVLGFMDQKLGSNGREKPVWDCETLVLVLYSL